MKPSMPRGTIDVWDTAHARGQVTLENGTQLSFDASVATATTITAGMTAEVFTSIGLGGQLKARLVLVEADGVRERPFDEGVADLQLLGLLSGWSVPEAQAALPGVGALTREDAGSLLLAYYGDPSSPARASSDRVLMLDEHLGDSPNIPVEALASLAAEPLRDRLIESTKGLHPFSLSSVLNAFNAVLQQTKVGQHFFLIDVDADRYVLVAARNEAFARAAHASVLRIVS
jgi:hypothetical protein